jgi:hypothetical protein
VSEGLAALRAETLGGIRPHEFRHREAMSQVESARRLSVI